MYNKKSVLKFQIFSAIFVAILGTILHFTYDWSNNNSLVGAFSAINESTWEHLKLLYFPMLLTTILGYFYIGKNIPNFLCAKTLGIIVAISFTTIFFYTYQGILGYNLDFLNILSFFIAVILGEFVTLKFINSNLGCNKKIALLILIVLFLCFIIFTYNTPQIGLFKDPITGFYGIY